MDKPAWTGGPWRIGTDEAGHNANIIATAGGIGICEVYGIPLHRRYDEARYAEGMANAHLIHAAPKMAAALQAVWDAVTDPENDSWIPSEAGALVKAALAKARGETDDG